MKIYKIRENHVFIILWIFEICTSHNLKFVDCGETIKEEIKEEIEEEYQRDPLRLSNAVLSLDEPVTYEEFICEG